MRIAITGATGFLGRYIVRHLACKGHDCSCWHRKTSDRGGFEDIDDRIHWHLGDLSDPASMYRLVDGAEAVVHAALDRPGAGFRGAEGDVPAFAERNVIGTLRLIEEARSANVPRFVFISTCAVHERILEDRKLDEAHPLWPTSHYGAHKAAVEKFVHSYGFGDGYGICSLRPTGIYGVARPVEASKWYDLVQTVRRGEPVSSGLGGKEVHAADVARAVEVLIRADNVAGECYNCYDMYISHQQVAHIAKGLAGSSSDIQDSNKGPKHQIDTSKLRALGMEFGGVPLLEQTIARLM